MLFAQIKVANTSENILNKIKQIIICVVLQKANLLKSVQYKDEQNIH